VDGETCTPDHDEEEQECLRSGHPVAVAGDDERRDRDGDEADTPRGVDHRELLLAD
jgi:hypothetical protein